MDGQKSPYILSAQYSNYEFLDINEELPENQSKIFAASLQRAKQIEVDYDYKHGNCLKVIHFKYCCIRKNQMSNHSLSLIKFMIIPSFIKHKQMIQNQVQMGPDQIDIQGRQFSYNGALKILALLTAPQHKKKLFDQTPYLTLISKVRQEEYLQQKDIANNLPQVWRIINHLYLTKYLQANLFIQELNHSVSDCKVIKIILGVYRAVIIRQFIQISVWRGERLRKFIDELGRMQKDEIDRAVKQRPSHQDIQNLLSINKLMQYPEDHQLKGKQHPNSEIYLYIVSELVKKPVNFDKPEVIFQLFRKLLNLLYRFVDRYVKSTNDTSRIQKYQKIKITILYLKCLAQKIKTKKLQRQTQKSKITAIVKEQGFQILKRYFDDLIPKTIQDQKQYCFSLFENGNSTVIERNPESQEGSGNLGPRSDKFNEQFVINIFEPK